ncbi:MAG: rhodanese-like domain-containing protein [Steroidobacterales bacterium]
MQQLIEYLRHHPYLAGNAALLIVIVAVYEMRMRAQSFAALSPMQAVQLMNQGALIIDVRGKDAYDSGHIGEARNIPAATLETQAGTLDKWRDRNVIIYCDNGPAAAAAAGNLAKLGFTKAVSLNGGLNRWIKDNMPVIRSAGGNK